MAFSSKILSIYTDGACSGNPGPGGWAMVAYFSDDQVHELGGATPQTTNNRMELQGAIAALEFLLETQQSDPVTLFTDSEYVKKGITSWVAEWKRKNWKTASGKAVQNQDLWEQLDQLHTQVNQQLSSPLQWQYVRGHSGDRGNDRCDEIARAFSLGSSPTLRQRNAVTNASKIQSTLNETLQLAIKATQGTERTVAQTIQSSYSLSSQPEPAMTDNTHSLQGELSEELPREVRVAQLQNTVETLHIADEIARQGYLITSSELADLMDVNASAVTSRGDNWVWRNWVVSRVRREGNQILWQLERVD
ncbi:MAG: ribonuclease HI [Synechococcales cyanobacterium T60_A2020_003]|nr:ribonuclease HI [Synechococcales cyanobacterium T60_A2020_003]